MRRFFASLRMTTRLRERSDKARFLSRSFSLSFHSHQVDRRQFRPQALRARWQACFHRALAHAQVLGQLPITPILRVLQHQQLRVAFRHHAPRPAGPGCVVPWPATNPTDRAGACRIRWAAAVGHSDRSVSAAVPCLRRCSNDAVTANRYSHGATFLRIASAAPAAGPRPKTPPASPRPPPEARQPRCHTTVPQPAIVLCSARPASRSVAAMRPASGCRRESRLHHGHEYCFRGRRESCTCRK